MGKARGKGPEFHRCTDSAPRHQDGSGYIDENELDALLKDLYEKNKKVSPGAPRLGCWGLLREVGTECPWEHFTPLISHNKAETVFGLLSCFVSG